jgi:hypothetical protein
MRSSNANPNTIGSSAVGIITALAMLEPFSSEHVCRSNLTIESSLLELPQVAGVWLATK